MAVLVAAFAACEFETYRVIVLVGFLCVAFWAMLTDWRGRATVEPAQTSLCAAIQRGMHTVVHGDDLVASCFEDMMREPRPPSFGSPLRTLRSLCAPLVATHLIHGPGDFAHVLSSDFYDAHVFPVVSRVLNGGSSGSIVVCGGVGSGTAPLPTPAFPGALACHAASPSSLGAISYILRCVFRSFLMSGTSSARGAGSTSRPGLLGSAGRWPTCSRRAP